MSNTLDSISNVAKMDLQAAHDQLIALPSSDPARADPRAKAIVSEWADSIFARGKEPGPIVARRHILTRVVNDELTDDRTRQRGFDLLLALEPRDVTATTRHYVFVYASADTPPDLAPYGRVAIVTELATRPDVAVASSVSTAYEIDQVVSDAKLRAVNLEYDVTVQYGPTGLVVKVKGKFLSFPNKDLLGEANSKLTKPDVTQKDPPSERDLALIGAQRVAASLTVAKAPAPKPPPNAVAEKPTAPCHCDPGDPLCACL
jgi:hypothetical protein